MIPLPGPAILTRDSRRLSASGVFVGLSLCLYVFSAIPHAARAQELLPYDPPSVRQDVRQATPSRISKSNREKRLRYYRQLAEEAHERGDDEAEKHYLRLWRQLKTRDR